MHASINVRENRRVSRALSASSNALRQARLDPRFANSGSSIALASFDSRSCCPLVDRKTLTNHTSVLGFQICAVGTYSCSDQLGDRECEQRQEKSDAELLAIAAQFVLGIVVLVIGEQQIDHLGHLFACLW